MPLLTSASICLAAGLLLGFGGHLFPGVVLASTCAAASLVARRTHWAGLAMLTASGALIAALAQRGDEKCLNRLVEMRQWSATLLDRASDGGFVSAILFDAHGCRANAALAVQRGSASAGGIVKVSGTAIRGERGLVVQAAEIAASGRGPILLRMRISAGAAIDRLFGEKAGMARALLIADSRQIESELRDQFADAGLVHMLSISGLHVGIIAAATLLLLRALRLSLAPATVVAAVVTGIYVLMIGAPSPAVRSAAMLFVVAASRLLQRPTSPWAALAVGALVPLVQPSAVLSLGYQLSVTGMVGLISAGILCRRVLTRDREGWRAALIASAAATVLASLATAPIIAWHFGRISLIAPLTNLLAAPLMLLLQPLLFLALLLAPLRALSSFVADASLPLLSMFEGIARIGAEPKWSAIDVAPTLLSALLAGVAAAAVTAAAASAGRRPLRYLVVGGIAVAAIVWWPLLSAGAASGRLEIHLIDVGQGDAIGLRLPDRRWILFDAGRSWQGGDAGRRQIVPYLRRRGGDLFAFVLSHPHSDHVGGAASVIRWLKPRFFWDAAYVAANEDYLDALRSAAAWGSEWRRVRPGEAIGLGRVALEFLAPDSAWAASLGDPNEASTVALVSFGDIRILLTGDAEREEEEWLVSRYGSRLRATVLKVAHHGSRTSSTEGFIDAVRPRVALVSVGATNRYGHPSPQVVANLAAQGALVLRTDQHGTVVLSTDGRTLWVSALGERWAIE